MSTSLKSDNKPEIKKFINGTSMDFNAWKIGFIAELRKEGCYQHIDLEEPGMLDANGVAVENNFILQRICPIGQEAVEAQNRLQAKIATANLTHQDTVNAINAGNLGPADTARYAVNAHLDNIKEIGKINNSYDDIEKFVHARAKEFDDAEEKFFKQRNTVVSLMMKYFGAAPLNVAKEDLQAGRPRLAWQKVVRMFHAEIGQSVGISNVMLQMNLMTYRKNLGTVNDHMSKLQDLNENLRAAGQAVFAPAVLLEYLYRAIERSKEGTDLMDTVRYCRDNNSTVEQAMTKFQTKQSQEMTHNQLTQTLKTGKSVRIASADLEEALVASDPKANTKKKKDSKSTDSENSAKKDSGGKDKRLLFYCENCKKKGHTSERCWFLHPEQSPFGKKPKEDKQFNVSDHIPKK